MNMSHCTLYSLLPEHIHVQYLAPKGARLQQFGTVLAYTTHTGCILDAFVTSSDFDKMYRIKVWSHNCKTWLQIINHNK